MIKNVIDRVDRENIIDEMKKYPKYYNKRQWMVKNCVAARCSECEHYKDKKCAHPTYPGKLY